jgi:1-phosphofructokinase family hexose kinase
VITCLALSASLDITYLVDSLEVGGISRPREVYRVAGGKALNVARAAATLGAPVRAVAPLGGEIGLLVHALLLDSGVDLMTVHTDGQTRMCVSIASDDDDRLTELYEPSAPLRAPAWGAVVEQVEELPADPGGWIALSGSIPDGVEFAALVELLLACREAGLRIAIDSHGAALAALVDGVRPELVKVNRSEAAGLLGLPEETPIGALADGIRARTRGLVVLTDGVAGSWATDGSGPFRAAPDPVLGRFPVGSGDSYLAGLLVGLGRGDGLADSVRRAAARASATAPRPGAAIFGQGEVDAAFRRITVTPG